MGAKNSDDALLYNAEMAVNAQAYDSAISIITQKVSGAGQQKNLAREILASAYAGKCGLNFIDYTQALAAATTGSAFVRLATPFVGKVVSPASCLTSLQTLDLIGSKAQRTLNQNAFAAIVGMVLMGSATRLYTDDAPLNGDGGQDVANISCSLTEEQMNHIVLGYAYMAQNFSALTGQIGASSSTSVSDSIAACTGIAGAACSNTDPAQITPLVRDTMKDLMNTIQYGVGAFNATDPLLIPTSCI